jgi:transposase
MRTVAQIQHIRYLHDVEGWSIRRIAREFHVSRKTIRLCLDRSTSTEEPKYRRTKPAPAPRMGPYKAVVDAWLLSDQKAPPKQRHTARRIYERLRDEYSAEVAESTVRRYVGVRRRELGSGRAEVFLQLVFPPGETAQVDWGEAVVRLGGKATKVYMFCMRLCHSTAAFVMLFPSARMECFLEGHVRAFAFFGGVPHRIIYDNLRSAVLRIVGRGRELNNRFQTLAAHYLFEPVFATPGAGWEKGLVEDLVGTARRSLLVPVPETRALDDANGQLLARLLGWRRNTLPGRGGRTVGELWDEERPALRPLPPVPYRASTSHSVRVSKFATVQHQRVTYSVPARHVGQLLRLEAYYDHVEVYDGHRKVAEHRLGTPGQGPVLELDHYLDVLARKPGAIRHARVVSELGSIITSYRDAFLAARPQAYSEFVRILLLVRRHTLPAVLEAIATAHERRLYDAQSVESLLGSMSAKGESGSLPPIGPRVEQTPPTAYDELLTGVRP